MIRFSCIFRLRAYFGGWSRHANLTDLPSNSSARTNSVLRFYSYGHRFNESRQNFSYRNGDNDGFNRRRNHEWTYGNSGQQYAHSEKPGTCRLTFLIAGVWTTLKSQVGLNKPVVGDSEIKDKVVMATLYCREQKYEDALTILHDVFYNAQERKDKLAINYCLDMMANIYYFLGRYDEAERAFTDLIQRIISEGKVNGVPAATSPVVVELSLKLADVYAMKGEDEKAVSGFEFCIETQKGNLTRAISDEKKRHVRVPGSMRHDREMNVDSMDPFALYGLVLETYARYLIRKGRVDDSQIYINRALEMALEIYGPTHPHTLSVMNNFAMLCMGQDRFDVAEHYLKDVVARVPVLEGAEEHVVNYYTNYAEILWHLGRYDESVDYARKAAKVANEKDISEETKKRTENYLKTLETDWKRVSKRKGN